MTPFHLKSSNENNQEATGIILAGGMSLRMGTDKGLLEWQGKPMIQYSIDLLSQFCSRIIISTSNAEYKSFGFQLIPDVHGGQGPMGGLFSCLQQSTSLMNICLPCDVPDMKPAIIKYMVDQFDGTKCIVPLTPLAEPLIAIYPKTILPVINQLITQGNYKMIGIFTNYAVKYIPLEEFPGENTAQFFKNVNSRSDLPTFDEQ